jgi:hypothetical protein
LCFDDYPYELNRTSVLHDVKDAGTLMNCRLQTVCRVPTGTPCPLSMPQCRASFVVRPRQGEDGSANEAKSMNIPLAKQGFNVNDVFSSMNLY